MDKIESTKNVCVRCNQENSFLVQFHWEVLLMKLRISSDRDTYTYFCYIIFSYYWNYSSNWFLILGNKALEDERGRRWEDVIRG